MDHLAVHRYRADMVRSDVPVLGWGSWMDAGTADAVIRRFCTFPSATRAVIGAWDHGGLSHASPYQAPAAAVDPSLPAQWAETIRFFDAYLNDADDGVGTEKVLYYYTLGEERWKQTSAWPPKGTAMQRWYLAADHALSRSLPADESGTDTYAVDFQASSGDHNRWWEMGPAFHQTVVYAKRAEAARHLLTYTTPPLPEDAEIAGHPVVTLCVASTQPDCAFYVYLEDVDERGHVTYVTEGQLRAIHRKVSAAPPPYRLQVPYHSFKETDALPLVPGEVAEITFGLLPTSALIRKGHRLRLGIAGHDEGTFVRIPATGTPVWTVVRNRFHASCIDLPVVGLARQESI
jgi:putative CocE/NonD family hydrolase